MKSQIYLFFHCTRCLAEKPVDISPRDWGQIEVGWTTRGLQAWCKRHEINVIHIDFEGRKHPAVVDAAGQIKPAPARSSPRLWKCPRCGQVIDDGKPCGCGAR